MKKALLTISIFFLSLSLFASIGYTISGVGYSSEVNYGGVNLSLLYEVNKTPLSIELGSAFGTLPNDRLDYLNSSIKLKLYPVSLENHPFEFMFQNDVFYRPLLIVGYDYYHHNTESSSIIIGLAPLGFEDVHYRYSYLSPYITLSFDGEFSGWGIELIKMSYVF